MVFPDYLPVVEVWLVCCGFTEAKSLAMKINTFFKLINEQVTAFFFVRDSSVYVYFENYIITDLLCNVVG